MILALHRVNHKAVWSKVRSLGIDGRFHQVLSEFLTDRRQRVTLDGCFTSFSPVISGVPQGSVFGPLPFTIYTFDMWCAINMIAYADGTTIYAVIPFPEGRQRIANVLNRDVSRILSWCDRLGRNLNSGKSHSIVISLSRMPSPPHPDCAVNGVPIPNCTSLKLL